VEPRQELPVLSTKENESKQVAKSIFYRGRKYLRNLAEHSKLNGSFNKNYWEFDEERDISTDNKPLIRQIPNEILKPLPISNKQLRNKFMRAKIKHYQMFGRQF